MVGGIIVVVVFLSVHLGVDFVVLQLPYDSSVLALGLALFIQDVFKNLGVNSLSLEKEFGQQLGCHFVGEEVFHAEVFEHEEEVDQLFALQVLALGFLVDSHKVANQLVKAS